MERSNYRGRFAPSPTGPLHLGSLIAALGSYLDAKHQHGTWLVRMEDLDTPRCVPGAAADILQTLDGLGLHSDEDVIYQSQRLAVYDESLERLQATRSVYPCACTRKEIADSALHGIDGQIYPGTCRNGIPEGRTGRAWRVRTDDHIIRFDDALQGHIAQSLEREIGDFVVKRADGLFAYQLAVVVDDAAQDITHVVRGADLIASTARQIHLQNLLGLPTPHYMHLPIVLNAQGEKLSKQTLAAPLDMRDPAALLLRALVMLRRQPPAELATKKVETILEWAIGHWDSLRLRGVVQVKTQRGDT